ncbi:hypothetical protein CesoFtcFv8_025021 [Champsocephalus esox]|uniref:Uncharacterized protein n=1 Tax=Champsocephalus esox TaxID=159716 RepID=A0AAN8GFK1_9TELE|nr:hypothetical protein CesoFtcFv8_025021 [Champsocephalus esox]
MQPASGDPDRDLAVRKLHKEDEEVKAVFRQRPLRRRDAGFHSGSIQKTRSGSSFFRDTCTKVAKASLLHIYPRVGPAP